MEEIENWDDPPDPPIVGKVTHFSIELIWNKELLNNSNSSTSMTSFKSSTSLHRGGVPRTKYILQEEELGGLVTKGFGTVCSRMLIFFSFLCYPSFFYVGQTGRFQIGIWRKHFCR